MADERARGRHGRVLTQGRGARWRVAGLTLAAALALSAALLVGPSSVTAVSGESSFGRAILTVQGVAGHGPAEPVRYEVDAILTARSSAFRAGVVCRFELPRVTGEDHAVVTMDIDRDALLGARALPFGGPSARLEYREVSARGETRFVGAAVEGDVLLLAMGPRDRGLTLHLAFGARVRDAWGEERLLTDGEAATLPDEATHPATRVVWHDETPPDAIYLDAIYVSSDCSGDPLYEPGYVIEPAAYGPEPYGEGWEDGTGWGGVDWGYGTDHGAVDPGDGSVLPGDGDWDGWEPGDNWSGDQQFIDEWTDGSGWGGGGTIDGGGGGGGGGGNNDVGWDEDGGWDQGSGWDEPVDPGGDCSSDDDPGYEDDGLDCAGDDPGGGDDSGLGCDGGSSDTSSDDAVDTSCDGGEGGSDPFDCGGEANASLSALGAGGPRPGPPRHRRWRGWNLSPLLGFLGWWAFLRFRRGAPLRADAAAAAAGTAEAQTTAA
jgi:hypothetical protein